jgi:hypothetical protein
MMHERGYKSEGELQGKKGVRRERERGKREIEGGRDVYIDTLN